MTLSERGWAMIEMFSAHKYISFEDAHLLDQRPFRSMLIRKYIAFKPGRGFHITKEGEDALYRWYHTVVDQRKDTLAPLTKTFNPQDYRLDEKVYVMKKRAAA